eukprot:6927331-Prymnesium_polylepis.2
MWIGALWPFWTPLIAAPPSSPMLFCDRLMLVSDDMFGGTSACAMATVPRLLIAFIERSRLVSDELTFSTVPTTIAPSSSTPMSVMLSDLSVVFSFSVLMMAMLPATPMGFVLMLRSVSPWPRLRTSTTADTLEGSASLTRSS